MQIKIRQEQYEDHPAVTQVIRSAFESVEISDHREHLLVERLRKSTAFIPELSLIAELNDKMVGHVLLTQVKIQNAQQEFDSLALAPISVLPEFQGRGIGKMLMEEAHKTATKLGYRSIVILGDHTYYQRFGYQAADTFGIRFPFDAPLPYCLAVELREGSLNGIQGIVRYPPEFELPES